MAADSEANVLATIARNAQAHAQVLEGLIRHARLRLTEIERAMSRLTLDANLPPAHWSRLCYLHTEIARLRQALGDQP